MHFCKFCISCFHGEIVWSLTLCAAFLFTLHCNGRKLIFLFFYIFQERRDLVGAHGLDQLGSTATSGSFSTATTHRLRHTPTTDFQPPYFPPPYSVPQQTMDFAHHHVNPDPYSHINHYNTPHHQGYGVNPTDRHHLLGGNDPISNSLAPRGFPTSYDTRRPGDYGINRPEVLIAPRGPHELHDPSLLGLQSHGLGLDDGAQVSVMIKSYFSSIFLAVLL